MTKYPYILYLLTQKLQELHVFFCSKERPLFYFLKKLKNIWVHDYTRTIHFGVIPYILYGNVACGNAKGMWLASGVHLRKNLA